MGSSRLLGCLAHRLTQDQIQQPSSAAKGGLRLHSNNVSHGSIALKESSPDLYLPDALPITDTGKRCHLHDRGLAAVGQRPRRANGLANEEQWHWLSGCFMASLLGTFAIKAAVQPISGMLPEPAPLEECRMRWLVPSLRLSMGSAVVRSVAQPQSAHRR